MPRKAETGAANRAGEGIRQLGGQNFTSGDASSFPSRKQRPLGYAGRALICPRSRPPSGEGGYIALAL